MPTGTGQSADSRHVTSLHWLAHCRLPPLNVQRHACATLPRFYLVDRSPGGHHWELSRSGVCIGRPIPAIWRRCRHQLQRYVSMRACSSTAQGEAPRAQGPAACMRCQKCGWGPCMADCMLTLTPFLSRCCLVCAMHRISGMGNTMLSMHEDAHERACSPTKTDALHVALLLQRRWSP